MVDDRGENARLEDLPVNPCKPKHLTNMRSQGEGQGIQPNFLTKKDQAARSKVRNRRVYVLTPRFVG